VQSGVQSSEMRLYAPTGERLYINADERARFFAAASVAPAAVRLLCLTLALTGCRLSEALALTRAGVQSGIITVRSLKKRGRNIMREIPVPEELTAELIHFAAALPERERIWPWCRSTAWRHVKAVMTAAGISGRHATPKGLRHGYGVHAIRSGVQLNMLQKWLGHADMATTAIYANVTGCEELEIAKRMWGQLLVNKSSST